MTRCGIWRLSRFAHKLTGQEKILFFSQYKNCFLSTFISFCLSLCTVDASAHPHTHSTAAPSLFSLYTLLLQPPTAKDHFIPNLTDQIRFAHLLHIVIHLPQCSLASPLGLPISASPQAHAYAHTPLHTRSNLQGSLDPVALATYGSLQSGMKV